MRNISKKKARRVKGEVTFGRTGINTFVTIRATKQRQFVVWYADNWSGWVEARSTDLRSWYEPYAPGSNDIYFYSGEKVKRTYSSQGAGATTATVHFEQSLGNTVDGGGGLRIAYDAEFEGHWNGGRHFDCATSDNQHQIECY